MNIKMNKVLKKIKNHYFIDASINIEQLSQKLNFNFPDEEDYDTVAGFILSEIGKFPKKGDIISYEHFDFIINEIKKRRIISIEVIVNPI